MTMITPSYLGETIEYSSLHACRSTLEDPTAYAFNQAKQMACQRLRNPRVLPQAWNMNALEEQDAILGRDPWAYGLGAANRKNLDTAMRYTHAQGLTGRLASVDEVFVPIDEGVFSGVGGY